MVGYHLLLASYIHLIKGEQVQIIIEDIVYLWITYFLEQRGVVGSIKPINHTFKGINFVKKAPLFPDHLHPFPPPLSPLLPHPFTLFSPSFLVSQLPERLNLAVEYGKKFDSNWQ